jgi:hypothetical protein
MRLYLYATDNIDPALATNVTEWGVDPIDGEYDPQFEFDGRGANIATLGGRVIQDYGQVERDRKILIKGSDLTLALKTAIEAKYVTVEGQFNFTARKAAATPADVWRVQFQRNPRGFSAVLDAARYGIGHMYVEPAHIDYERYTYEIVLLVVSKLA